MSPVSLSREWSRADATGVPVSVEFCEEWRLDLAGMALDLR